MALTGLQIQKLLPHTNCKECGSNTCLAFAMKLAARKTEISLCPYASDEAKQVLGAAYEPPVKLIELGIEPSMKLGEETVLYRHEKTFVHQPLLAININDTDSAGKIDELLNQIQGYVLERVGQILMIDMVAVTQKGNNSAAFIKLLQHVWQRLKRPLVVRSSDTNTLISAASILAGSRSLLAPADGAVARSLWRATQENGHSLAVTAAGINELIELTGWIKDQGFNNLVIQWPMDSPAGHFQINTIARRAAIKNNLKSLGYPFIRFLDGGNLGDNTVAAISEICKYGGICVLPSFEPAQLATLMTLRLNIYTDPQKPIQVEPRVYPIGEPGPDSPVFVTTNFSLTYFIVSGEIENCGISAWLVVPDCEGMSVLTAWAAGKFSAATIGKFAKEVRLENQVRTRQMVIPGLVSQISGELEENLPGWKVLVGPQDASDLEGFVKTWLN